METTGSAVIVPAEWGLLVAKAKEFSGSARTLFIRTVAIFNNSAGQHLSTVLTEGGVLGASRGMDHCRKMCADALNSVTASAAEKQAVRAAWLLMDGQGAREAGLS